MFVAELTMQRKYTTDAADEVLFDAALSYYAALRHHGQVCGEEILGWVGGELRMTIYLARPNAHQLKYHSQWGCDERRKLRALCAGPVTWRVLDNDARGRQFADWRDAGSLYLFTHAFDRASPVCAGDSGEPIPPYLLGLADVCVQNITGWAGYYRTHDDLWLGSGRLEIAAYKELADPNSEHAQSGRSICQTIESATGLPTYYYVMRYWGRRDEQRERSRRCPGCGRRWARKPTASSGIDEHEFRCDRCRLVAAAASTSDDERYAHIGEYRAQRR